MLLRRYWCGGEEVVVFRSYGAAQRGGKSSFEGERRNFKWVLEEKMELAVPGREERDAIGERICQNPKDYPTKHYNGVVQFSTCPE